MNVSHRTIVVRFAKRGLDGKKRNFQIPSAIDAESR